MGIDDDGGIFERLSGRKTCPRDDVIENLVAVYSEFGSRNAIGQTLPLALIGLRSTAIVCLFPMLRQLENGKWTSKLGPLEDIEHASLEGVTGAQYGQVVQMLRRKKEAARISSTSGSSPLFEPSSFSVLA